MKKKMLIITILLSISIILFPKKASASYNYSPWQNAIESAHSMSITQIIDNVNITDVDGNKANIQLGQVRDVFEYEDKIYVSDATANKVFVFNSDLKYVESFPDESDTETKLNVPVGLFVIDESLYVADSQNNRIAIFDLNTKLIKQTIENPNDDIFLTNKFTPLRVVVDRTGRLLVVAHNIFEGIMEFEPDGTFTRYYGTNTIQMGLLEALVYKLSSKEQKEKMSLKLQPSFTSVDIDDFGYVYAVSSVDANEPVKKLNFKGKNILLNNGYINVVGDAVYEENSKKVVLGPSVITDVAVNADNNRFSILDSKRGKIFTYDKEGHLLYIFGELGSQNDKLQAPSSITYFGEKILVTDQTANSIFVYEPTRFGELINKATKSYYEMDYESSEKYWQEVIVENSNYFLAYAGVGKTNLRNQEFKEAVENLKRGHDYFNYSKAYEEYRNEKIKKVLPFVIVGVLGLSIFGLVKSMTKSVTREGDEE